MKPQIHSRCVQLRLFFVRNLTFATLRVIFNINLFLKCSGTSDTFINKEIKFFARIIS